MPLTLGQYIVMSVCSIFTTRHYVSAVYTIVVSVCVCLYVCGTGFNCEFVNNLIFTIFCRHGVINWQ